MSDIAKQFNAAKGDPKRETSKAAERIPEGADLEPAKSKSLTPEEQMALYEKELKENDWGHQPC